MFWIFLDGKDAEKSYDFVYGRRVRIKGRLVAGGPFAAEIEVKQ